MHPLKAPFIKDTTKRSCLPASFANSLIANAGYYYDAAPWKYVPGPWLIKVVIPQSSLERYVAILGASDANQRGLAVYDSVDDYNVKPPRALALQFENGHAQGVPDHR